MLDKVLSYVEKHKMLAAGDTVVAGVSGGADSLCLLFLLKEISKTIPFDLYVVHVNHGIRTDAGEDEAYVKAICEKLEVPIKCIHVNIHELSKEWNISEEEAGRRVRYDAFRAMLKEHAPQAKANGTGKIAVAHHAGDRAETILFHLFRGTGLDGLVGIKPVRDEIIRPLLGIEREKIEQYLAEKQISFCIDSTNEEDTYTRNRIRHHILPYVEKEISANAIKHINQTAELLEETKDYLECETKKEFYDCFEGALDQEVIPDRIVLSVPKLNKLHIFMQKQVIRYALSKLHPSKKDIGLVHVESICSLLAMKGSHETYLPYGIRIYKEYDILRIERPIEEGRDPIEEKEIDLRRLEAQGEILLDLENGSSLQFKLIPKEGITAENLMDIPQNQYTKWLDYDKIKKSLRIRTRKTGDYLTINDALSHKSLKEYMVQEKIPKNDRDLIYLLAEDEHILWVIGYRISSDYKIKQDTKRILQIQLRGGHS